jgi:proline dehydrogenase
MTLADLLPQLATMTDADAKGYALVFGAELYAVLQAAQQARLDAQHRAAPVQLTDARWMLCADLLLEIGPGGLYADGFALLPEELFTQVDVMPWADALALLPAPSMEP